MKDKVSYIIPDINFLFPRRYSERWIRRFVLAYTDVQCALYQIAVSPWFYIYIHGTPKAFFRLFLFDAYLHIYVHTWSISGPAGVVGDAVSTFAGHADILDAIHSCLISFQNDIDLIIMISNVGQVVWRLSKT